MAKYTDTTAAYILHAPALGATVLHGQGSVQRGDRSGGGAVLGIVQSGELGQLGVDDRVVLLVAIWYRVV